MQVTGLGMIPLSTLLLEYLICCTWAQISEFGHNFLKNRWKKSHQSLTICQKGVISIMDWKMWPQQNFTAQKKYWEQSNLLNHYSAIHPLLPSLPSMLSVFWYSCTERWRRKEGKTKICKSPSILGLRNPQNFCL